MSMIAISTPQIAHVIASDPHPLPFDPSLAIRSFLLRRSRGNILVYGAPGSGSDDAWIANAGGITRRYLGHGHESMFAGDTVDAPTFAHDEDRRSIERELPVKAGFKKRHALDEDFEVIPIPGHTPGSTAYLWDNGTQRLLFTGDSIYLRDGEWRGAVLDSSDRDAYVESLELIRGLDFDLLVPWAATRGEPYVAHTDTADREQRIDAILERVRAGASG